jgi:hypothetical protein
LFGKHPQQYQTHIFKTQWPGWEKYFEHYCRLKAFREYWAEGNLHADQSSFTQWQDTKFENFVNGKIDTAIKESRTGWASLDLPDSSSSKHA